MIGGSGVYLAIWLYVEKLGSRTVFLLCSSLTGWNSLGSATGAGRQYWCSCSCTGISERSQPGADGSAVSAAAAAEERRSSRELEHRKSSSEGTGTWETRRSIWSGPNSPHLLTPAEPKPPSYLLWMQSNFNSAHKYVNMIKLKKQNQFLTIQKTCFYFSLELNLKLAGWCSLRKVRKVRKVSTSHNCDLQCFTSSSSAVTVMMVGTVSGDRVSCPSSLSVKQDDSKCREQRKELERSEPSSRWATISHLCRCSASFGNLRDGGKTNLKMKPTRGTSADGEPQGSLLGPILLPPARRSCCHPCCHDTRWKNVVQVREELFTLRS